MYIYIYVCMTIARSCSFFSGGASVFSQAEKHRGCKCRRSPCGQWSHNAQARD